MTTPLKPGALVEASTQFFGMLFYPLAPGSSDRVVVTGELFLVLQIRVNGDLCVIDSKGVSGFLASEALCWRVVT
jgi:hypothetical protein